MEQNYQIAFAMDSGDWDIVETFPAQDHDEANEHAEEFYGDQEWYVLCNGININGEIGA